MTCHAGRPTLRDLQSDSLLTIAIIPGHPTLSSSTLWHILANAHVLTRFHRPSRSICCAETDDALPSARPLSYYALRPVSVSFSNMCQARQTGSPTLHHSRPKVCIIGLLAREQTESHHMSSKAVFGKLHAIRDPGARVSTTGMGDPCASRVCFVFPPTPAKTTQKDTRRCSCGTAFAIHSKANARFPDPDPVPSIHLHAPSSGLWQHTTLDCLRFRTTADTQQRTFSSSLCSHIM